VPTIHAILAIRQRLYRDLVGTLLSGECGVRVYEMAETEQAETELAVAATLRQLLVQEEFSVDDPVIVVTSTEDTHEMPTSFSRLLTEFPEVTIVSVSTGSIRSFQMRIKKRKFRSSRNGLLKAIRNCLPDPLQ
jgi:hypothetical protein